MIRNKTRCSCYLWLSTILLTLFLANPAPGQEVVLELDPAQTRIGFDLGDVFHSVHGTFKLKSGNIRFDSTTGAATGLVVVDATSGESGSKGRDRKMHKDILESPRFSEITFTPARVQGRLMPHGQSQVEIQGVIKLHGSEHEVTMNAQVQVTETQLTGTAKLIIPYVEWGLKNPSNLFLRVSSKVDIDLQIVGHLTGL